MPNFLYIIISTLARALSAWAERLRPADPEKYLNDLIEQAKPNMDKIEDPEKWLQEVRGYEPEPEPLRIEDGVLIGVDLFYTPNMGGEIKPKYLIIHYTANGSLAGTVKHFQKESSSVSAHLIIDRDGHIAQMVPFNRAAWHAGRSEWGEDKELNGCSIGIELVNWGLLETDIDGRPYTWTSERLPDEESKMVFDEKADRMFCWHKYTPEQLEVCFNVARLLVKHYGLENVLGHSEVSPRRKLDPGPLFPMSDLLRFCYEDESE